MDHKIDFEKMNWYCIAPGAFEKKIESGDCTIRLVKFEDTFEEVEWCSKKHMGYVVEGKISIQFPNKKLQYKKGDAIYIPEGLMSKHKAEIDHGDYVILFLIE